MEGKGREGKGREGKGSERKGREGREGKGREGKRGQQKTPLPPKTPPRAAEHSTSRVVSGWPSTRSLVILVVFLEEMRALGEAFGSEDESDPR